jgi:hypothetical protein
MAIVICCSTCHRRETLQVGSLIGSAQIPDAWKRGRTGFTNGYISGEDE